MCETWQRNRAPLPEGTRGHLIYSMKIIFMTDANDISNGITMASQCYSSKAITYNVSNILC